MKITIACKQFRRSGGAETFLDGFVGALAADGHQVRVLAAQADDAPGVEVVRLKLTPVPRAFRDYALARASAKALAVDDADLTFSDQKCWGAHVVRPGGGVQREYVKQRQKSYQGLLAAAGNRISRALSIRERLRIRIDDGIYANPGLRCIIANSHMVADQIARYYPHVADRVTVVHNGTDVERFAPALKAEHRACVRAELGSPDDALVGVFVGNDWRRKGLYPFIETLGLLARKGTPRPVWGVVVGRGPQGRAMRFAAKHGAQNAVRFTGPARPEPYYGAADVVVMPSYFDTFGFVVLEGMACGLPAITAGHAGSHELVEGGVSGFCAADPSDAAQLAGFFEEYLDEGYLEKASRAARAAAEGHTVERQYREILEAVRSCR